MLVDTILERRTYREHVKDGDALSGQAGDTIGSEVVDGGPASDACILHIHTVHTCMI